MQNRRAGRAGAADRAGGVASWIEVYLKQKNIKCLTSECIMRHPFRSDKIIRKGISNDSKS
mgnify:CR=1 FL=1